MTSGSPVKLVLKLTTTFHKQIEQRIETSGKWAFKKELTFDDHLWSSVAPYNVTCELHHMVSGQVIQHKFSDGLMNLLSIPLIVRTRVGSNAEKTIVRDAYRVMIEDRRNIYTELLQMARSLFDDGWDTTNLLRLATDYLNEGILIDNQRLGDFFEPWDIIVYREGYKKEIYKQVENPNLNDVYIVNIHEPPFVRSPGRNTLKIFMHDFESRQ